MKNVILIFLLILSEQLFGATAGELLKPSTNAYDFTLNNAPLNEYSPQTYVDKVEYSVDKVLGFIPRTVKTFECLTDSYNTAYCPSNLAPASENWDYEDGYSTSGIGQVVDYANKTTDINIQNVDTTCIRSTGSIIPESPANQWHINIPAWQGSAGAGFDVYITKITDTQYKLYYRLRADYDYTSWRTKYINKGDIFQDTWANGRDVTGFKIDLTKAVFYGLHPKTLAIAGAWDLQNMPVCKSCGSNLSATQLTQTSLANLGGTGWLLNNSQGGSTITLELSSDKKKYYYKIQAGVGTPKISTGNFINSIIDSISYYDGKWNYSINFELTESYVRVGQYGNYNIVYSFNDLVCYLNITTCPTGHTETTGVETAKGECKRTIEYTYYNYLCSNDKNTQGYNYAPINSGGNCNKTDPNTTIDNSSTLDDACNSSSPPTNNCKRLGFRCNMNDIIQPAFVDGEWKCSPFNCNSDMQCGYGSCQGYGTSQDNYMTSALSPLNIEVKQVSSTCSNSYEYTNGTATPHYIKICNAGATVAGAICLEKNANNVCVKFETTNQNATCSTGTTKQYTYYSYTCPYNINYYGFNWEVINNVKDPGCIDDTFGGCLNQDAITNNCKRQTLSCASGTCEKNTTTSSWECVTGTITAAQQSCNAEICDLVMNSKISYCLNEVCPTVNGVYERDSLCYMMSCPTNTVEVNGMCLE